MTFNGIFILTFRAKKRYNIFIAVSVVLVALIMQRIPSIVKSENRIITTLLDVLSWSTVIYLFFVLLVGLLPYGLLVSLVGAGISLLGCLIVRDPSELKERLHIAADIAESMRGTGLKSGPDRDTMIWAYIRRQRLEVLRLPLGSLPWAWSPTPT